MSPLVPDRKSLVQSIKDLPGVRSLREARYARAFRQVGGGMHYGVFPSFEAAQQAAPANLGVGFDRSSLTRVYDYRMQHAMPSDYPVLFWLAKVLTPTARIFDYGGHIGISFHCFQRYLEYPPGLTWRVCDVPTIIEEGARLAKGRGATQLSFTTAFTEVEAADILLALGSLQFIEQDLWTQMGRVSRKPKHILISKVPLYEGPTFFTLQNTGDAVHPYRISNRAEFVAGVSSLGYRLVDEWTNREQSCHVPFEGGTTIDAYTGLLFTQDPALPGGAS